MEIPSSDGSDVTSVMTIRYSSGSSGVVLVVALILALVSADNKEPVLDCYLLEEQPPTPQVGCDIVKDFGLDKKYSAEVLSQLRFSFLALPASDKQYFQIDELTGIIRTTRAIDREQLCPRAAECFVKFDVAVRPIQYFMIIKVRVNVLDINDNTPSFPNEEESFELSESSEPGTSFIVPSADDLDSGRNGVTDFEIVPATSDFELLVRDRSDGSRQLRLALRGRLDRETKDFYRFRVFAIDGGEPVRSSSLAVNITVLDSNDNVPEFENASYEFRLREDVAVGAVVFRVQARDPDLGSNGAIVYNFTKETIRQSGHLFGIRSESGQIYTKDELDFEAHPVFMLYVTASDGGHDESLSSQALVVIRLDDVNDNPPVIRVNTQPINGDAQPQVVEGSDIGSFVAHVTVEDRDSNDNGKFHCFIADSNQFELRQMYSTEFKVVTLTRFDRELRDLFSFTISCRDEGEPSLSSSLSVKVKVADRNDHAPTFLRDFYSVAIEENKPTGTSLTRIAAVDRDTGLNGEIVYSVDEDDGGSGSKIVAVDPSTGIVTSRISFDFENASRYDVSLIARDCGDPVRSATVKLAISVQDTDDERPVFRQSTFTFSIAENQPPGAELGKVMAFDRDSALFNRILYSIEHTSSKSIRRFLIDPTTGQLSATEELDREEQSVYELIVSAKSPTGTGSSIAPPDAASAVAAGLFNTCKVVIRVVDANDNRPIFEFPTEVSNRVSVSIEAPVGHVFTRVKAYDADEGQNAKLSYRIDNDDVFDINHETGDVCVKSNLMTSPVKEWTLVVTAVDGGSPSLSQSSHLIVTIKKETYYPLSSDPIYSLLASEDLAVILAMTLATILVSISIVVAIICLAKSRRRRHHSRQSEAEKCRTKLLQRTTADDAIVATTMTPTKEAKAAGCCSLNGGNGALLCDDSSHPFACNSSTVAAVYASGPSNPSKTAASLHDTDISCDDLQMSTYERRPVVAFIKDPTSKKISPNSESNSDSGRGQSSEEGGTGNNGDAVLLMKKGFNSSFNVHLSSDLADKDDLKELQPLVHHRPADVPVRTALKNINNPLTTVFVGADSRLPDRNSHRNNHRSDGVPLLFRTSSSTTMLPQHRQPHPNPYRNASRLQPLTTDQSGQSWKNAACTWTKDRPNGPAGCSSSSSSRASNVTRDLYENRKYHTLVPCYPVNNRRSCSQLQLTMIGMDSAGAAAAAASGFAKAKRYDQSANVDDEDLDDDGGNYLSFKKL